jgi:hypothetical protein
MKFDAISLMPLSEALRELSQPVCDVWEGNEEPSPDLVLKALLQLFSLLEKNSIDPSAHNTDRLNPDEVNELGEYGLTLLEEMTAFADDLGMNDIANSIEDLAFPFAIWLARNNVELKNIAPVVNALSRKIDVINENHMLKQLFSYTSEIIECLNPVITQDTEKTESTHPWRILVINRALLAARSHDLDLMKNAFDLLTEQLPDEAASFFEESVEQMHLAEYPEAVQELMQQYFLMHCTSHTLH